MLIEWEKYSLSLFFPYPSLLPLLLKTFFLSVVFRFGEFLFSCPHAPADISPFAALSLDKFEFHAEDVHVCSSLLLGTYNRGFYEGRSICPMTNKWNYVVISDLQHLT